MLTVLQSPLSASEVQQLRSWLSQPEAELCRHVLASNIAALQADVGELLIEGEDKQDKSSAMAKEKARDAAAFHHALAVLQNFRESEELLNHVTVLVDQPISAPETNIQPT